MALCWPEMRGDRRAYRDELENGRHLLSQLFYALRRQSVQAVIISGRLGHLPNKSRNIFDVKVSRRDIERGNHETRAAQLRVS